MSFNIFKLVFSFLCLTFPVNSKTNEVIELQVHHRSSILRGLSDKTLTHTSFDRANIGDDDDYPDYYDYRQYNGMHGKVIPTPNIWHRGEYYTRVIIGYPLVQEFYLIMDTGSDFSWLQCQPCDRCFEQIDPIYNKSKSRRYRSVYCDDEYCKKADHVGMCDAETNKCIYATHYGDSSTSEGAIVLDTLTFVNSNVSFYQFVHGCGYNNKGIFGYSAGILGLGPGSSSLPYQIKVDGFSYCLVAPTMENGSSLTFGSNLLLNLPSSVSVPMIITNERPYYYIDMIGISIGGKMLPLPQSTFLFNKYDLTGVIVDSGAVTTLFPQKAFDVIVNEVGTRMNWTRTTNLLSYEACFIEPDVKLYKVPSISMTFHFRNGKTLEFSSDHFVSNIQPNIVCLTLLSSPRSVRKITVIGTLLQQSMRLTFELSRSLLEFTPDQC